MPQPLPQRDRQRLGERALRRTDGLRAPLGRDAVLARDQRQAHPRRAGFSPWSARSLSRERPTAWISAHWVSVCGQLARDGVRRRTRKLWSASPGRASRSPHNRKHAQRLRRARERNMALVDEGPHGRVEPRPTRRPECTPRLQVCKLTVSGGAGGVPVGSSDEQDAIAAGEARGEAQVPERHGQKPGEVPARPFPRSQKLRPNPPRAGAPSIVRVCAS